MIKKSLKIYLAHPMSGLHFKEINTYYKETRDPLKKLGYTVFTPISGKAIAKVEGDCKPCGYKHPIITDKAILSRDMWMVNQADIVLMDLSEAKKVSIGCVAETAFAYVEGKHVVMVMEKDNLHEHAFMLQMGNIIFETKDEAMEYLKTLIIDL